MRFLTSLAIALLCLIAGPAIAQPLVSTRPPAASQSDPQNIWILDLTSGGRVTIWLRPDVAPQMVERIRTLTRQKFYDGITFHRVIDDFMAQGGDPRADLPTAAHTEDVVAETDGVLTELDAMAVGLSS